MFCLFGFVAVVVVGVFWWGVCFLFIFIQISRFVYNHSYKILLKNTTNFFASYKYVSQL